MVEPPSNPDPLAGHPQYSKVKDLGIGSFGSVALYQRNEDRGEPSLCAVKFMPRSGPGVEVNLIQREIQSHRVLRHPHVIRFKQLGLTGSHIYMCMEYADQGDLLGFLRRKGPLPEADARWLFQQFMFGLDYCHLKGVVNRDLKPENLLLKLTPEASKRHRRHQLQEREQQQQKLFEQMQQMQLQKRAQQGPGSAAPSSPSSGAAGSPTSLLPQLPQLPPLGLVDYRTSNTFNLHIKIADFGLSKRAAHSLPKTRVGTINYMAPEVLLAGPAQRYDGHKADIWSAGVVLYAMIFSRVPFEVIQDQQAQQGPQAQQAQQAPPQPGARDRAATIQRILEGDWAVPPGMSVTPQCLHLLTQMLIPDPARRISMAAILDHPWFRSGLPPAALTMNTALVRQQVAQGQGAGEQTELEIEGILGELRKQAEAWAVVAETLAASNSLSSDSAADERRAFEVKGLEEEEGPLPPAACREVPPTAAAAATAGVRFVRPANAPPGAAAAAPPPQQLQQQHRRHGYGNAGNYQDHSPPHMPSPANQTRPGGTSSLTSPTAAAAAAAPAANAFLVRLACLGPEDVGAAGGAVGTSGGGGDSHPGLASRRGGAPVAPASSSSHRAAALEAVDCIDVLPRRG